MQQRILFASDFDGTLTRDTFSISAEDAQTIRRFSERNLFGMVSGRDPFSLRHALGDAGVPYDFIICRGGAIAFDADGTRFIDRPIPRELTDLERFLRTTPVIYYHVFGEKTLFFRQFAENPSFPPLRDWMLRYHDEAHSYEELGNAYALSCQTDSPDIARAVAADVNERFPDLHATSNMDYIDITAEGVSKCTAMEVARERFHIVEDKTFVIGDSFNDASMIERFRGFAIRGNAELESLAEFVVDSVHEALDTVETLFPGSEPA